MKLQIFLFVISTAIAVSAAAQSPTNPVFQEFPYFQQYTQLARKMCGDQGQACVQSDFKTLGINSLKAGEIIEVQYMAPNSGDVYIDLQGANTESILYAFIIIELDSTTNKFRLYNRMSNGDYTGRQDVNGFPFTCPPVQTRINVQIEVTSGSFAVSVNGKNLASYPFNGSFTPDKVTEIECGIYDANASIKGKIEKISVTASF